MEEGLSPGSLKCSNIRRTAEGLKRNPDTQRERLSILNTTSRDSWGPGQCSLISAGPAEPSTRLSTQTTKMASSSCPTTGMKSGTRSNGMAR